MALFYGATLARTFFDREFREYYNGKIFFNLYLDFFEKKISCTIVAFPFPSPDVVSRNSKLSIEQEATDEGVKNLFSEIMKFFFQYGLLEEHFNTLTYDIQGDVTVSKTTNNIPITHQYLENNLNEQKRILLNLEGIKNKKHCLIM